MWQYTEDYEIAVLVGKGMPVEIIIALAAGYYNDHIE
jgi:hypothetical protein